MILIPLKLKYRNKNHRRQQDGTLTFMAGSWKSKSMNAGTKSKQKTQGTGARRRSYGPWYRQVIDVSA